MPPRISLFVLIIIWWVGAFAAGIALLLNVYLHYFIVGSIGWTTVVVTSALIMYELKRIKNEDMRKKQLTR